jgi:hypothetical protein
LLTVKREEGGKAKPTTGKEVKGTTMSLVSINFNLTQEILAK